MMKLTKLRLVLGIPPETAAREWHEVTSLESFSFLYHAKTYNVAFGGSRGIVRVNFELRLPEPRYGTSIVQYNWRDQARYIAGNQMGEDDFLKEFVSFLYIYDLPFKDSEDFLELMSAHERSLVEEKKIKLSEQFLS